MDLDAWPCRIQARILRTPSATAASPLFGGGQSRRRGPARPGHRAESRATQSPAMRSGRSACGMMRQAGSMTSLKGFRIAEYRRDVFKQNPGLWESPGCLVWREAASSSLIGLLKVNSCRRELCRHCPCEGKPGRMAVTASVRQPRWSGGALTPGITGADTDTGRIPPRQA